MSTRNRYVSFLSGTSATSCATYFFFKFKGGLLSPGRRSPIVSRFYLIGEKKQHGAHYDRSAATIKWANNNPIRPAVGRREEECKVVVRLEMEALGGTGTTARHVKPNKTNVCVEKERKMSQERRRNVRYSEKNGKGFPGRCALGVKSDSVGTAGVSAVVDVEPNSRHFSLRSCCFFSSTFARPVRKSRKFFFLFTSSALVGHFGADRNNLVPGWKKLVD